MRAKKPANKYWNGCGTKQAVCDELAKEIPGSGPCLATRPALERLRVARNCYYDLYNNGLCNLRSKFLNVFGIDGYGIVLSGYTDTKTMKAIDAKMTRIIMAAKREKDRR